MNTILFQIMVIATAIVVVIANSYLRRKALVLIGMVSFLTLAVMTINIIFPLVSSVLGIALVVGRILGLPKRIQQTVLNAFWVQAEASMRLMKITADARSKKPSWMDIVVTALLSLSIFILIFTIRHYSNLVFADFGLKPIFWNLDNLGLRLIVTPFWVLDFMFYGFVPAMMLAVGLKITPMPVVKKVVVASTKPVKEQPKQQPQQPASPKKVQQPVSPIALDGVAGKLMFVNGSWQFVADLSAMVGKQSANSQSSSVKQRDQRQSVEDWLAAEQSGENYWKWQIKAGRLTVSASSLRNTLTDFDHLDGDKEVSLTVFNAQKSDKVYFTSEVTLLELRGLVEGA